MVNYLACHHDSWAYRHLGVKLRRFVDGQKDALPTIEKAKLDSEVPTYWFHASSLGEYGIARPIMMEMRRQRKCNVVLTFFSPTGVEALKGKSAEKTGAECVTYLPLDKKENVRHFLDKVQPSKVIFIKSEYWFNYLQELRERKIETYLVSAYITQASVLFKWYGGLYRKALQTYTKVYTQDEDSRLLFEKVGYDKAMVMGDPLYDNAILNAQAEYRNEVIERFVETAPRGVLVAGSIDEDRDLELVSALANAYPKEKFIIVPHEVAPKNLAALLPAFEGKMMRYGECTKETDFSDVQLLVIDYVGELSKIYRYGKLAYVGGGFTPLLHSVIEPSVYGLPVSFGPCIKRKAAPLLMMKNGTGKMVKSEKDLCRWYDELFTNEDRLRAIDAKAREFVTSMSGRTEYVVKDMLGGSGKEQVS